MYVVFIYFYRHCFFVLIAKIILQIGQLVKDCREVSNKRKKLNNRNKINLQVFLKARILKTQMKLMKMNLKPNQAKVFLQSWDIQISILLRLLNYKKLLLVEKPRKRQNLQKKEES